MKYIRLHEIPDDSDIILNIDVISAIVHHDDEDHKAGSNIWTMEPGREVPIEVAESLEAVLRLIDEA